MSDPHIYPIAGERIAFGSRVRLEAGKAWVATPDDDAGVTPGPSHRGDATHYEVGETMRVLLDVSGETPARRPGQAMRVKLDG